MNLKNNIQNVIIETICLLYILLFIYSALSKLLEFENFQAQLGQSPILGAFAGVLSYAIIVIEFVIAFLLAVPKTRIRLIALFGAFGLMILFTVYIIIILNFSSNIPCSCGGVLENMSWAAHLIFNIFFLVFSILGIFLIAPSHKKTILKLTCIVISVSLGMTLLYVRSEHIIHKENPFVRRFIPGSSKRVSQAKLHNNTLYFAGSGDNAIYIADQLAPLHIFKYDSTLKIKQHYTIELDHKDFTFRSVQVKVIPPYFFVMDGTVPIVYRGKISNWKAVSLIKQSDYYFSKAVVIDSSKIVFRTQTGKSRENVIGLFNFENESKSILHQGLLQKQIDGFFDTDGMMNYSAESQLFLYLYYYRNQFIVTTDKLQLKYRGNTIDTTEKANIKPVFIKEKGQRKLASIDHVVNKLSTIRNNILFVNSSLLGRYEPKEMWDTASIVDAYDLNSNSYISSFYIYNVDKSKMKDMLVSGNNLYVIIGTNLQRYQLNKELKINLHKNISGR